MKRYKIGFRHKHLKKLTDPNFGWGSLKEIYDDYSTAYQEMERLKKENPDKGDYCVRPLFPHEDMDRSESINE